MNKPEKHLHNLMTLKQTPLYKECIEKNAKMVSFSGWEMPIYFSSLIEEHNAVRNSSGLFDISHMGVFSISGVNPKDALQKLVPSDLHRIGTGEACYTVLLNDKGGIIDDLIIYDLGVDQNGSESLLIVINAACTLNDINWIQKNLKNSNLQVSDKKNDGVLLALQGPDSTKQLKELLGNSFKEIPRFGHKEISIRFNECETQQTIFIARTGYTGEDGYEILANQTLGLRIWSKLIENGAKPCGLGARDTLRLEACMPLYGNDLNQNTSPFEAGLGWLIHLEVPETFIGKDVLIEQSKEGIQKKLVALELEGKAIARKGYEIISNDKVIGEITSGSWSPTLKKGIALAYLPIALTKTGTKVHIKIRQNLHQAIVTKKPFYRRIS